MEETFSAKIIFKKAAVEALAVEFLQINENADGGLIFVAAISVASFILKRVLE